MDINKEREVFEKHASKFFTDSKEAFKTNGDQYLYDEVIWMWDCWIERAKAQAAPEGFVLIEASELESLKSDNEHFTKSCIDWTERAYKQRAKVDHIKNEVERFKQSGTSLDLGSFLDNLIEFSTFKHNAEFDGFVLVPKAGAQYFSHDFNGDGYKYHDTLEEAKKEASGNLDWYSDQVADGRHVNDMGEFNELSYGLVIGSAEYSIDHVVTQDDIDKGEYSYEVGTEILSLYLSEAQEQSHE